MTPSRSSAGFLSMTRPGSATPSQATVFATGIIDLQRARMIDLIEGRAAVDLRIGSNGGPWSGSLGSTWWPRT